MRVGLVKVAKELLKNSNPRELRLELTAKKLGIELEVVNYCINFFLAGRLLVYGSGIYDFEGIKRFISLAEKLEEEVGKEKAKEIFKEALKEWRESLRDKWVKHFHIVPPYLLINRAWRERPFLEFFERLVERNLKDKMKRERVSKRKSSIRR
jgi:hypothetical protein